MKIKTKIKIPTILSLNKELVGSYKKFKKEFCSQSLSSSIVELEKNLLGSKKEIEKISKYVEKNPQLMNHKGRKSEINKSYSLTLDKETHQKFMSLMKLYGMTSSNMINCLITLELIDEASKRRYPLKTFQQLIKSIKEILYVQEFIKKILPNLKKDEADKIIRRHKIKEVEGND